MTPQDPTQNLDPRFMLPRAVPPVAPVANGAPQPQPATGVIPKAQPIPSQAITSPAAETISTAKPMPTSAPAPAPAQPSAAVQRQQQLQQQGPTIPRIHNPLLRTLATIGDVVEGTFAPRAERLTPGTQGNYSLNLERANQAVRGEQQAAKEAGESGLQKAQAEHLGAETGQLIPAQVKNFESEAATRGQPKPEQKEWAEIPGGAIDPEHPEVGPQPAFFNKSNPKEGIVFGNVPLAKKEGALKEGEMPLGDKVPQLNKAITARYQVLHPGAPLPEHYQLPANATQKDFERLDKLIEGEEKAFGTKANQDQTAELRKQTAALAQGNREERGAHETRKAAYEAWKPTLDSAERFNVMTKNYEDAVKDHDQQAMLSLLANHLGMTMGLQKGARLTRDIIREAQQSRPWLQGMGAKFDKDGYLSGVTLTPQQMRQMVDLGRERFSQDRVKSQSEAAYMGAKDEGPERTPNRSTINHYLGLANGDLNKAKQLAAEDGWSIK